jgi:REP element-mobilizing transposase RayT
MDRILDGGETGPLFLRIPEIASMVVDAIRYRDLNLKHYKLHSYVVMPNHDHLLITPLVSVSRLMQSLKRFTATQANRILARHGQLFWQDESYDRLVRNDQEFQRIAHYIEMNPVKAGLVAQTQDFPWSSAKPIDNRHAD